MALKAGAEGGGSSGNYATKMYTGNLPPTPKWPGTSQKVYAPSMQPVNQMPQDLRDWMASRPVYQTPTPAAPAPVAAAPATAAPATSAPATQNQYPWLDSAFGKYFQAIQQDFADRGLLDSTNKLQPMTELADAYSQRYAQEARTDNQNAVRNAIDLWSTLSSGQLQLADLARMMGLDANMNLPAQPSIFSSIFNQPYLPPTKGTGQVGDAPVVTRAPGVDTTRGDVVPTYGLSMKNVAYEDEQKNAAAQRAIQQAYLKLAQNADAREQATADKENDSDLWAEIATVAMSLFDGGIPASEVIKRLNALYNIDLVNESYNLKNQRATDILSLMNAQDDYRTPWSAPKPKAGASSAPTVGGGSMRFDLTSPTSIAEAYRQAYLSQGQQYDLTTPTGKASAYRAAYRR